MKVRNYTGTAVSIDVMFSNPLPRSLTNSYLVISGAHIENRGIYIGTIRENMLLEPLVIKITSWSHRNTCTIFAKLFTDQVSSFSGEFVVQPQIFNQ